MKVQQLTVWGIGLVLSSLAVAKPMPDMIIVEDKAVVPIVKTQVIRRVSGQAPVRTVEATIFEVTNKGQDIVSREVVLQDNESTFSEKQMSNPVIKKGSIIVPTSKIDLTTKVKQEGEVIAEARQLEATGVEFKKGEQPVRRELSLEQQSIAGVEEKMSHAVLKENGVVSKDVVIFSDTGVAAETSPAL